MKSKLIARSPSTGAATTGGQQPAADFFVGNPTSKNRVETEHSFDDGNGQANLHANRGFTLLIAALISSVVLSLGISIFEIAQKQVSLSSMGRDSQFAFYTADTGAECALFWDLRSDIHPNTFATSTASSPAPNVSCNQTDAAVTVTSAAADSATSYFQFDLAGKCVQVSVQKCAAECDPVQYPNIRSIIHADGFNTTCATVSTNSRALQRSVELHY